MVTCQAVCDVTFAGHFCMTNIPPEYIQTYGRNESKPNIQ